MEKIDPIKHIVAGCLRNERRAQEEFFKMYYGKMLSVCMRYIKDRDSAQEVLQDAFIKVFEKLELFDFRGSIEGWLRRIVSNTAIDGDDNDFKQVAENEMEKQEDLAFMQIKAEVAMEAIQSLSPAYRTVFNMYVFEEYTHKEIAEILGINEGTSKSNLSKAKLNLQKKLNLKFEKIQ